jgi:hypothetical protein
VVYLRISRDLDEARDFNLVVSKPSPELDPPSERKKKEER